MNNHRPANNTKNERLSKDFNFYISGKKERFIEIAKYAVLESALKKCGTDSNSELVTGKDRILYKICMIPAFFLAFGYRKNKMRI